MWINGKIIDAAGRDVIAVTDPATEAHAGDVIRGNEDDVRSAVSAAAGASPEWRTIAPGSRAALLRDAALKLTACREELADLLVLEQGKPKRDNLGEIDSAIELFNYYSAFAWRDRGGVNPAEAGFLDFVVRGPIGPVACIVPWNFPIMLMVRKIAPALAAGNTVVVKPSEETPLSALLFAQRVLDHLPAGVFNVVTGYGGEVGQPLVEDPRIRHVAFTGSTATGLRIAAAAAAGMKGVTLELGGKDPLIVGPDVDISQAVPAVAFAGLLNAGQCCTSTERIFVADEIRSSFVDALVDHVRAIRVGNGSDELTDMGPMIREDARIKVSQHVGEAVDGGAKVLTGGQELGRSGRGWFYEPTVVVDVPDNAKLFREETFGPVLPVAGFQTIDEAIRRANDSVYGLGATVLSNDPAFIKRCIDDLEVGNVFVNDPLTANNMGTFGGTKLSGLGRELGAEGFENYRESKHVHWKFGV
jgi:betaine-aldehyde dehydrogenase